MTLLRSRVGLDQLVIAPNVEGARGPVCLTCGRVVDYEELVEGEPGVTTFAKVLVRHHGAEELRTFEMGSQNWDERDLASYKRRVNWFSPHGHEDLGLGRKVAAQDDEPERKPLVVVPR